jgi:hypothetical protein
VAKGDLKNHIIGALARFTDYLSVVYLAETGCKLGEFGWISYLEVHEGLGVGDDIDLARTVEPMHQLAARRHG